MPELQKYILDPKIIARGFSSVVYKGIDKNSNEQVAIKCIDESVLDDPQKKKMLANEMNIQWSLRGEPNIVQIKAQFYQKNNIYIVTEFCEYGDLKNKIKQKGKFVEAKAVSYMLDIIHGLETLVRNNIVHRDIKSSNILISKKGIKIGDFGFAFKAHHNNSNKNDQNVPSAGSPLYQAPQVLEDGKYASHLSDIWSLGVVFFEMVTGRLPYPAKNKEGLVKLIQNFGIRTILPENISLKSKEFLVRTLKKDPTKRMTPQQLFSFEFDDQILFKIKQHRARKKQQEMKKQQDTKHETKYPEINQSTYSEPKIIKSQHSDHEILINEDKKNFQKFDNNVHEGKNFLDPKDFNAEKFKRKASDQKNIKNDQNSFKKSIQEVKSLQQKQQDQVQIKILTQNKKANHQAEKMLVKQREQIAEGQKKYKNGEKEKKNLKDSIISIDLKIELHNQMQTSEIIDILLHQIDIIRFFSRIVHKMEQTHHLHVSQHSSSVKQHRENSLSNHILSNHLNYPDVYIQMKVFMYRAILQIQRLQFLPQEKALKFFRSQEYEEIRTILDTYKSKLDLMSIKQIKWKGIHYLEHQIEQQILFIYRKIDPLIHEIQTDPLSQDTESRLIKKLAHKIQALNYLILFRYDYLIMQREQMMIDGHIKNYELIKHIIEQKYSNENGTKKTFEQCKVELTKLETKIKRLKLV